MRIFTLAWMLAGLIGCSASVQKSEIPPHKKDGADKKHDAPETLPKTGISPSPPQGSLKELPKDPRFQTTETYYSVPVFFGTNRCPKLPESEGWSYHFRRFFWPPSALAFAGLLLMSWLLPCLALAALGNRTPELHPLFTFAIWVILAGLVVWGFALVGLVLFGTATISYLLFQYVALFSDRSPGGQLLIGLLLWLGSYFGFAAFGAQYNNQRDQDNPGNFYGNISDSILHFGLCDVTVPKSYLPGSGVIPRPVRIGQVELPENPDRHIVLHELRNLEEEEFFARLRVEVNQPWNPAREAFVFIHGYNNTFTAGVYRTALIARDLEYPGPAILFSWPSQGDLEDYPADEESVDYCVRHFTTFLRKVSAHSGAKRLQFFAHSMGSRALAEALQTLLHSHWPERELLKEVVLAAPDIPQQKFRDQILPELVGRGPRMTLYASSRDVALATSKAIHKMPRAGQGGKWVVLAKGLDTVDASHLDVPMFNLGHNYAFDHPSLRRDIQLLLQGLSPPRESLTPKSRDEMEYWLIDDAQPKK